MEPWRKAWRAGFAPQLGNDHLRALRAGLEKDDPALMRGATTTPPPLQCVQDLSVEAACVIGYCGWQGDGLETVGEVEEFFARLCFKADNLLGEPAGSRYFLNWWDDTPRAEARAALLAEVDREMILRGEVIRV